MKNQLQQPRSRYHTYCLRVSLIPITLILAFCVLLTTLDLLGRPVNPARNQHLGWQSWDVIRYPKTEQGVISSGELQGSKPGDNGYPADSLGGEEDIDETDSSFAPSLPLGNWDPTLRHTTGLTEVTVMPCFFPPWIYPRLCSPPTTPEEDKLKGRWVRVERDLNVKSGLWYLNIYYRRTRRLDVPLITSLLLLPESASPPGHINLSQYTMAKGNFRDGVWPKQEALRLWYKTRDGNKAGLSKGGVHYRDTRRDSGEWSQWDTDLEEEEETEPKGHSPSAANHPSDKEGKDEEIITEIDVLFGDNRPFWSFERVTNGPVVQRKEGKWETVDIVVRKGNPVTPLAPVPRFGKDGKFKIMQIADLHYSVGHGECRDTPKQNCVGDDDTQDLLGRMLDEEKPDLVVFTGDQLNGQESSWDAKSVIAKVTGLVIDRKIPWTAIFGNHDSEIADDRAAQMKYMQTLPYSLAEPGPQGVDGIGNYIVKLYSHDASMMHLFTLYFLDSHARQKRKLPWVWSDYDYLKPSQIDWFLNTSASIKPIERPFTPDGAEDLGKIWKKRADGGKARLGDREQKRTLAKPNAMMFFHIPLIESYMPMDVDEETGEEMNVGTELGGDGPGSSKTNGHFFENGLLQASAVPEDVADQEVDSDRMGGLEVKVVGHGHCHNTDHCRRNNGIWFCFGGGSSYDAYGNMEFDRRVRIYEISDFGETVITWKRTEHDEVIEKQLLVSEGQSMNVKLVD